MTLTPFAPIYLPIVLFKLSFESNNTIRIIYSEINEKVID